MVEWDVHCETDASMSVSNKSLTDMLASVGESVSDGEKHLPSDESNQGAVLQLEARILVANIELQGVNDERTALQQQVDLLMAEIDRLEKTYKEGSECGN